MWFGNFAFNENSHHNSRKFIKTKQVSFIYLLNWFILTSFPSTEMVLDPKLNSMELIKLCWFKRNIWRINRIRRINPKDGRLSNRDQSRWAEKGDQVSSFSLDILFAYIHFNYHKIGFVFPVGITVSNENGDIYASQSCNISQINSNGVRTIIAGSEGFHFLSSLLF